MQNEVFDLLTQGSVWKKQAGKKAGRQAKVLFVTNTTLSEKVQEIHPIQVVYADDENNIYNRSVDEFASQYTFFNVDADLETRLESLLVFNEDDVEDEDDEDMDEVVDVREDEDQSEAASPAVPKSFAASLLEDDEDSGDTDEKTVDFLPQVNPTLITFAMTEQGQEEPALSEVDLQMAFVAYSQEPVSTMKSIQHRILFELNNRVTVETLGKTWRPQDSDGPRTVDVFAVAGPHFNEVVSWTDYVGVFPEVAQGRAFATVIVYEDITSVIAPEAPTEVFLPQLQVVDQDITPLPEGHEVPQDPPPVNVDPAIPPEQQFVQNLVRQSGHEGQSAHGHPHQHAPHNTNPNPNPEADPSANQ